MHGVNIAIGDDYMHYTLAGSVGIQACGLGRGFVPGHLGPGATEKFLQSIDTVSISTIFIHLSVSRATMNFGYNMIFATPTAGI